MIQNSELAPHLIYPSVYAQNAKWTKMCPCVCVCELIEYWGLLCFFVCLVEIFRGVRICQNEHKKPRACVCLCIDCECIAFGLSRTRLCLNVKRKWNGMEFVTHAFCLVVFWFGCYCCWLLCLVALAWNRLLHSSAIHIRIRVCSHIFINISNIFSHLF